MLVGDPLQATCCTTSRSRVSAAAPIPVPTPVNRTASQKRTASGDWSVEGMMLPAVVVGKDPGGVNFMSVFPRGYVRRQPDSSFNSISISRRESCPEFTTSCNIWRQASFSLAGACGRTRDESWEIVPFTVTQSREPRQQERWRGLSGPQYSLGKWITLFAKYSVISSNGKSVYSISFVNTTFPLPSSQVTVAVRS